MNLSKHIYLPIMLVLATAQVSIAQYEKQENDFDFFIGTHLQIANYNQFGASINFLTSSGHGAQLSLSRLWRTPEAKPHDAQNCYYISIPFAEPMDNAILMELRYQHVIYQRNPKFRIIAAAGMSWGSYQKITYLEKNLFSRCYTTDKDDAPAFGFSARLTADFPIFRATGFQLSLNANLNPEISTLGPEITWTFGKVRSKF